MIRSDTLGCRQAQLESACTKQTSIIKRNAVCVCSNCTACSDDPPGLSERITFLLLAPAACAGDNAPAEGIPQGKHPGSSLLGIKREAEPGTHEDDPEASPSDGKRQKKERYFEFAKKKWETEVTSRCPAHSLSWNL